MTRRDKWQKPRRPEVQRYFDFKEKVFFNNIQIKESGTAIIFVLPMPKSWSNKKKQEMEGTPHLQKPDTSNLLKAIEDAVFDDDSRIWNYNGLTKIWGYTGQIIIH